MPFSSLRLPLLLSVAVHAALAATMRLETQVIPERTMIDAWLRQTVSTAAAVAPAPAPTSLQPVHAAAMRQVRPARLSPPAGAAPAPASVPAQFPASAAPPEVAALALGTGASSPVPAPASAPVQAPALEPPRYDAAYLSNPEPPYPRSASRRGIEGTVLVEVLVSRRGEAIEVRLFSSAGDASLDAAALDAVHGWRFVPARRGSEAVEAWVRIPVVYRLN